MKVNIILFDQFETLDIFGPIEILARIESHELDYYSLDGGTVTSAQGTQIATRTLAEAAKDGIMVIPGGRGTRPLVKNERFLQAIKPVAMESAFCLSICTGSAVLAKAGVLDGRHATSNKVSFDWVMTSSDKVKWERKARWVVDEKFYTSSGVSAGMDMALGFISDQYGMEKAEQIAKDIEYIWNKDKTIDPFA